MIERNLETICAGLLFFALVTWGAGIWFGLAAGAVAAGFMHLSGELASLRRATPGQPVNTSDEAGLKEQRS